MANHIKGYLTGLIATFAMLMCIFCTQFLPESVINFVGKWWMGTIICIVSTILLLLFSGISVAGNGIVCFIIRAIVNPFILYLWIPFAFFPENMAIAAADVFTLSSLYCALIGLGLSFFFAVLYSSMKEGGAGFARFILLVFVMALMVGAYFLFKFLVLGLIVNLGFIFFFVYMLVDSYLSSASAFTVCEENRNYAMRESLLASSVSIIKRI